MTQKKKHWKFCKKGFNSLGVEVFSIQNVPSVLPQGKTSLLAICLTRVTLAAGEHWDAFLGLWTFCLITYSALNQTQTPARIWSWATHRSAGVPLFIHPRQHHKIKKQFIGEKKNNNNIPKCRVSHQHFNDFPGSWSMTYVIRTPKQLFWLHGDLIKDIPWCICASLWLVVKTFLIGYIYHGD